MLILGLLWCTLFNTDRIRALLIDVAWGWYKQKVDSSLEELTNSREPFEHGLESDLVSVQDARMEDNVEEVEPIQPCSMVEKDDSFTMVWDGVPGDTETHTITFFCVRKNVSNNWQIMQN